MFPDWLISSAKLEYVDESASNMLLLVKVNSSFSSVVCRLSSIISLSVDNSTVFVSSLGIVLSISLALTPVS